MPAKREDITDEGVQKLASYGCTQEEIAGYFGCSRTTITGRFGQAWDLGHSIVKKNVRMWQIRNARKGSDKMLIHLGQQYCGQSQKVEQTTTNIPVVKQINMPAKKDDGTDDSGSGSTTGTTNGGTGE